MTVEKISQDNFTFVKEDNYYVLYMGDITPQTTRPFTIRISGVSDSSKVETVSTCGCSSAEKRIIDATTLEATIAYKNCDLQFTKTIKIINNGVTTQLKIKGQCRNT